MDFNEYQSRAMTTNLRPRVFTEQQVREMLVEYGRHTQWGVASDIPIDVERVLDEHTTPLSRMLYPLLGLLEEAGEIAGKVKKIIRDQDGHFTEANRLAILLENGDALWYLSAIADAVNEEFSEVATTNLDKLADRVERGVLRGSGDNR